MTRIPPIDPTQADDATEERPRRGGFSRKLFLAASASVAGSAVAGRALADPLSDVPPRGPGGPMSATSGRSAYVHLSRMPSAGPGQNNINPALAINAKTPLDKLVDTVTPSDLHYKRCHAGVPDLDPTKHRLLIHGMADKPLILSVADLMAMPSVTRIHGSE
jgi:sulfane dehydrogenase subunit SoxC